MRALALLIVAACGKSNSAATPPPDPGTLINQMTDFADRCDACKADRDCLHPVRDDFDRAKEWLVYNGRRLAGDDRTKFDAALTRVRVCGDGAGLTFWVDQ